MSANPHTPPPGDELRLTVLLPAYNEEAAIGTVIDDVTSALADYDEAYEILVVDDASTDRTLDEARKRDVRIVERMTNGGSGATRKTGLRAARGEIIVMLDADGTYPAEAIPQLLELIDRYEQVNGARTSEQGTLKWLRAPTKWLIRKLASYLVGREIPDLNTGMKCFHRRTMLRYLHLIPNGFSCVTTMTLAYLTNDHATAYVPIEYRRRIGESKFHPIRDTSAYIQAVIRMVLYFKPLMIFLPVGGALLTVGIGLTVYHRIHLGHMLLSDTVILLASFATVALGLLADLIVVHGRHRAVDDD